MMKVTLQAERIPRLRILDGDHVITATEPVPGVEHVI